MAGVNGVGPGAGAFSASARAQYAAMAALRWHMFVNGLRSKGGAFELGARTVSFVLYAFMGLGLGTIMGAGAYVLASNEKWQFLPAVFWVACILWQVGPVMLASFQEQFDLGILLRFPVRFRSYYLLYVVFGLADVSTIIGALCCLGIWVGVTMARPELFAWTALALVAFAAFNVLLVRAVFAWIDRWLSQRKTREIVGALFMIFLLSLQLLNPALHQKRHPYPSRSMTPEQAREMVKESTQQKAEFRARYGPWLNRADAVQRWLPPGLAARTVQQADHGQPTGALASLGELVLWALAAGSVLARRLKAEYRGENLGSAPKRETSRAKAPSVRATFVRRDGGWRLGGSSPIAALMEKEARSLMRTLPLLWAIGAPLLMVLVLASLYRSNASGHPFLFALPFYVAFALMGFSQMFSNNLGAEGAGIQLLFLSPTPIRTVFLAKNLFHFLLFWLDALLVGILTTLRLGWPQGVTVAATAAWVLFALPCCLAVGNIFSLRMPFRIHPGRMTRQRGSQANALSSMLLLLVVMAVGAVVFGLCRLLASPWMAVPVFLALAGAAVFAWLRGLGNIDRLANQRRDSLLATLMKTE
jgi:ABC-2 type transport system permease protein